MKKLSLFHAFVFLSVCASSQTNIISTNPVAEQIMKGNYDPSSWMAPVVIDHPDSVSVGIMNEVSPDSLKSNIIRLSQFYNRNTGSDTVSNSKGIGAARRWVLQKFNELSTINNNRLVTSYLGFDQAICNITQHKNIFAVLPGRDTSESSVIIIEGHIDSRCESVCDTSCCAQGVEDNASGTALVIELARVMSKYTFDHTIVFLITIGEEQGLYGAKAFAQYCVDNGIDVKAVLNNDVSGGIVCGETSSAPGCPGLGHIDSTGIRLFSYGGYNSKNKQLARYIKLEYKEQLLPHVTVPMDLRIMTPEDRTGRSGDHVPFRQKSFASMRFTAANEHGDADASDTSYSDRQHSVRDTLGIDTDGDQVIDSFFVDFNYLARNAVINGNAAAMIAMSPLTPDLSVSASWSDMIVTVTQQTHYNTYRVGVRSTTNEWDSVYILSGSLTASIPMSNGNYIVSVASVDDNGVESLFSREVMVTVTGTDDYTSFSTTELLQNHPNPFDEATYITVVANSKQTGKNARIIITDLQGKEIHSIPFVMEDGRNELLYRHGYGVTGIYYYSLFVEGDLISTKKMIFAN